MGYLPLLLLWGLPQIWGSSDAPQRTLPLHCLQISSFTNRSWSRTDGSTWLGDVQIHTWSHDSDIIRYLKPWAGGTFTDQQWEQLQHLFRVYRSSFSRDMQEFARIVQADYPFELQLFAGCEVHPGSIPESFIHVAFQGSSIVHFQGTSWVAVPDAPQWVGKILQVLNHDLGTRATVQWLLNDTCPQFARGVFEAGKSELEKQVKPEAWLTGARTPGSDHLLLVCHVSGFYPKPAWAMWMWGGQEHPDTQQGDTVPNTDGTWYLRVTLDVAAEQAAGLACRVNHSSLGDQDIILHWGEKDLVQAGNGRRVLSPALGSRHISSVFLSQLEKEEFSLMLHASLKQRFGSPVPGDIVDGADVIGCYPSSSHSHISCVSNCTLFVSTPDEDCVQGFDLSLSFLGRLQQE
ncbi:Antigen-presenting glycoprotein CD1d [Galemys pyrenaicus]|uniref:Antigen-presenting glycoprotein CD1d n=1 Tax=Galemys pyrenaicus TaxID=202257 RepID=A0A8J6AKG7_GALPY|nr:Antigen-presenting glycoprotein CD1d [Galemys pyrenaicus]